MKVAFGNGFGAAVHPGLPATQPEVALLLLDSDDGATGNVTTVGTLSDSQGSVPAYESLHDINLSGLTAAQGDDLIYVVRFRGETGAGAVDARLVLYRIYLTLGAV